MAFKKKITGLFWQFNTNSIYSKSNLRNNKLAIISIVQNQADYLEDWIKFHYIAGVKDFYFYIDKCSDNTVEVIKNTSRKINNINVTIIPWEILSSLPGANNIIEKQSLSYTHSIKNFGKYFEWFTFIDTDEYLVPMQKKTIVDAISHLNAYSNISLQYTMFGSNGHKTKPNVSDIFAYTKKADVKLVKSIGHLNTKCIIKPSLVNQVSIHKYSTTDLGRFTVNDVGIKVTNKVLNRTNPKFYSNANLQLNHYYIRSDEEYQAKIDWKRNFVSTWRKSNEKTYKEIQYAINKSCVEDFSVKNFLALHSINSPDDFDRYFDK